MSEKKTPETIAPASSVYTLEGSLRESGPEYNYKSLSFFLERTAESIHRATVLVQQLEAEVSRLKYEVMATENEYKNLSHVANDLGDISSKSRDLPQGNK